MRAAHVYIATSQRTDGVYVGWTTNPTVRWKRHVVRARNGWRGRFYSAMRKYGADSFTFTVVESWPSETDALSSEAWLIGYLRAIGARLYNMSDGGEGTSGRRHTDEAKSKMSAAARSRPPMTEAQRLKMSAANTGRKHTNESRRKISESQRGRTSVWKGKKIPDEIKENMVEGALRRWEREPDTMLTAGGKTQGLRQWARELGIKIDTLRNRVRRLGWSHVRALSTPIKDGSS